jgi:hypothetical protein
MSRLIHRIENVRYHRNGISGAGFFLVQFRYKDGRKLRNMAAVCMTDPGSDTGEAPAKLGPYGAVACAVIDRDNPNMTWRGDHFAPELYAAIQKWDENRQAYEHKQEEARAL